MVLSRLTKFLSWMVRILYVVGLSLSFFAFFGGSVQGIAENKFIVLGVAASLSVALIVHELLIQERLVALIYKYFRKGADKKAIGAELKLYASCFGALAVFDAYCGFEFRAGASGLFQAQGLVQFLIQSFAIVLLYSLSSLLVPHDADAAGMLNRSSLEMLMSTTKATVKQWTTRLSRGAKSGLNLAGATATLMEDAGEMDSARRVRLMDGELAKLEGGVNTQAGSPTDRYVYNEKTKMYEPRVQATRATKASVLDSGNGLVNGQENDKSNEPKLKLIRKPRVNRKKSEKERVFEQLNKNPELKLEPLMALAKVSKGTAVKYRNQWLDEHPDVEIEEVQNG